MRKIKEALRLKYEQKLSICKIARSLKVGESTVERYLKRAKEANISWPLSPDIDDQILEEKLYPVQTRRKDLPLPDFKQMGKELKKKGVTLTLLWQEYRNLHPNGYGYTQFCSLFYEWCKYSDVWMPQQHKAGESAFIDYAGLTVPILDSNEAYEAQIFVAVLGASSYTYVEASRSQKLKDWIASHQKMFQFYGGVPELLVPDNLKSGVTTPDRYEPDINPTYYEMAEHYKCTILPARSRKPKDKAKVENGVLQVERQLLAPIRNHQFFTLQELNKVLRENLEGFNSKPFQKFPDTSRQSLFREIEKPALAPLPGTSYELFYWKKATINPGYHVMVEDAYYSVPYTYVKKQVDIRHNDKIVEAYHKGKRIAFHAKSDQKGIYITSPNHQPKAHQKVELSSEELIKEGDQIGIFTKSWIEKTLELSLHLKEKSKRCLGVIRLKKIYPKERLENACKRALHFENFSYKSIKTILEKELDFEPLTEESSEVNQEHENIRGPNYYTKGE